MVVTWQQGALDLQTVGGARPLRWVSAYLLRAVYVPRRRPGTWRWRPGRETYALSLSPCRPPSCWRHQSRTRTNATQCSSGWQCSSRNNKNTKPRRSFYAKSTWILLFWWNWTKIWATACWFSSRESMWGFEKHLQFQNSWMGISTNLKNSWFFMFRCWGKGSKLQEKADWSILVSLFSLANQTGFSYSSFAFAHIFLTRRNEILLGVSTHELSSTDKREENATLHGKQGVLREEKFSCKQIKPRPFVLVWQMTPSGGSKVRHLVFFHTGEIWHQMSQFWAHCCGVAEPWECCPTTDLNRTPNGRGSVLFISVCPTLVLIRAWTTF